jgi:hypothetical protein
MADALRPQALRLGREAEKGVDLALEEQIGRLRVHARHPVDVFGRIESDQRRHRRNEDMRGGLEHRNSYRSALEIRDTVDAVLGEQFEAPDMDACEDGDLLAAIEREDERTGEVRGEVDLSGGDRLVSRPTGITCDDVVDLRDAFVREQFVDDISRGGAEARAFAERYFRRLGRRFLRPPEAVRVAPNKPGSGRSSSKNKITPGRKHWRLPHRGTRRLSPEPCQRRRRALPLAI